MDIDLKIYTEYQKNYYEKIRQIRQRVKEGQKIRVGFFVLSLATFSGLPLYEAMKKDELFDTKIIMIPSAYNIYTASHFHEKAEKIFGKDQVLSSYLDAEGKAIRSFDNNFDMIVFANPYDKIVLSYHSIEHFAQLGVLTVFIVYGVLVSNHKVDFFQKGREMSCLWRYYLDTQIDYNVYKKRSPLKGKNGRFLGYIKMDSFTPLPVSQGKKRIIITAHHSMQISTDSIGIQFSCFLRYYDFYLRLAKMYPDVDFIFRPHPLWRTVLKEIWPEEMIEEYVQKINELPNMVFHTEPNFFDLFNISHAMINDCGSFNAEYMFTGKPLLMLSKGDEKDRENYNEFFAQKCMEHHYKAYSEIEIITFIEEVVLKGNDFMKEERMAFFEKEIKGNWPHSTEYVLKDIKTALLG